MRCTVQHKTDKFMGPALISEKDHTCLKLKMVPYSSIFCSFKIVDPFPGKGVQFKKCQKFFFL